MPLDPIKEDKDKNEVPKSVTVHVSFKTNSDKIAIINKATNEKSTVVAANKRIRLIHGRLYFIPVEKDNVDSDEFGNIKQYSVTADKFNIRYVKEGFACIDPIQHNALIENSQQLCILW